MWVSVHSLIAQPLLPLSSYGSVCTCGYIVASCLNPHTSWGPVVQCAGGPKCSCRVPPFPSSRRPFSLADLNDYQTHCTVMNYREDAVLKKIMYDEFVMWKGGSELCSICGWLDAGVEGRQKWVGRSVADMCAVHKSHVEKRVPFQVCVLWQW